MHNVGGCVHHTCLQLHTKVRNSSCSLCWLYPRSVHHSCVPHSTQLICSVNMGSREFTRLSGGRIPPRRHSRSSTPDLGPPRKSRKKLQVIICVLLVELCERFTFFGIVCNMILFCTVRLGYSNYLAATVNLCFVGASTLTPVLVGWFADTCLGRTKVLYLCAFLHFFGNWSTCVSLHASLKQPFLGLLLHFYPVFQVQPCFLWWHSHLKTSTSTPIT